MTIVFKSSKNKLEFAQMKYHTLIQFLSSRILLGDDLISI